jgi:hypothetical protein
VVLDANERRFASDMVSRDLVLSFYTNRNYRLAFRESNMFVFERVPDASSSP